MMKRLGTGLLAGGACALVLFAPSFASAAATAPNVVGVKIDVTQTWTDTGLTVHKGELVSIRSAAAGKVQFRGGQVKKTASPTGVPWSQECFKIAYQVSRAKFPAPGLACWSLIGRIGEGGKPFEVGTRRSFVVAQTGGLFLGINDNFTSDNAGTWVAAVSGASGKGNIAAPPTATSSSKKSSKLGTVLFLVGGLVVAGLLVAWAVARRRTPAKKKTRAVTRPKPAPKPKPEPVVVAAAVARMTPEERKAATPFDPESTDVNIFRVELTADTLQVGYNFFPEGTLVRWRVAQDGVNEASGEFVTEGGGSLQHFENIRLSTSLSPAPDGADVYFSWTIGDVPFGYNVRRDLGV
jgi:hypothetical protein